MLCRYTIQNIICLLPNYRVVNSNRVTIFICHLTTYRMVRIYDRCVRFLLPCISLWFRIFLIKLEYKERGEGIYSLCSSSSYTPLSKMLKIYRHSVGVCAHLYSESWPELSDMCYQLKTISLVTLLLLTILYSKLNIRTIKRDICRC